MALASAVSWKVDFAHLFLCAHCFYILEVVHVGKAVASGIKGDKREQISVPSGIDFNTNQIYTEVSQSKGYNDPGCLPSINATIRPSQVKYACQSLDYAFQNTLDIAANLSGTYSLIFAFIDDVYFLNHEFHVRGDKDNVKLASLKFVGASKANSLNTTIIKSTDPFAKVVLGDKENRANRKHHYLIEFERLRWTDFSGFIPACIIVYNLRLVNIYYNTFENNKCSAINGLDSEINLLHSSFKFNNASYNDTIETLSFPSSNFSTGGAVGLVFRTAQHHSLKIISCSFEYNEAVSLGHRYNPRYIFHNANLNEFGRIGGGLAIVFTNISKYNKVRVENCSFDHNKAFSGAGLAVLSMANALNNQFICKRCSFLGNNAKEAAGGAIFGIWDNACGTTIIIEKSRFVNNFADLESGSGGGATKLVIQSSLDLGDETRCFQQLWFEQVLFEHNCARMAFAIDLEGMAFTQTVPAMVTFNNCKIIRHHQCGISRTAQVLHSGTIVTNRVNIAFLGNNIVADNTGGSGLTASNAILYMAGKVTFRANRGATEGGAIILRDVSFLILCRGLQLLFINNVAKFSGGALFVRGLIPPYAVYPYNPSCFMQYEQKYVPPAEWKVDIAFVNNSAGFGGSAVFANTLWACSWTHKPPFVNIYSALRWSSNFRYEGNYLFPFCGHVFDNSSVINTDNAELRLHGERQFSLSPGEKQNFQLSGTDELNNSVYVVPAAMVNGSFKPGKGALYMEQMYFAIAPNAHALPQLSYQVDSDQYDELPFSPSPEFKQEIYFSDSNSHFDSKPVISVYPVKCPAGMKYDKRNRTCICLTKLDGVLRCSQGVIYLKSGFWANSTWDNQLLLYKCPEKFCDCGVSKDVEFAGCPYYHKDPNRQCVANREGTLCGKCRKGYGASLRSFECIKCDDKGKTTGLLILIVAVVTIFSIVILLLNPGFSTLLRGPVFFCQTLPFLFQPNDRTGAFVQTASTYFDLGSPSGLPIRGCLFEGINSLEVIGMEYIFPLGISLVLGVSYILHKIRALNVSRKSPFQAFWVLLVAVYKLLVETSFLLWFCVPIGDDRVFYYDGTIKCLEGDHVIWAFISAVVLLTMVFPPPILVLLVCCGYLRAEPHIFDALVKGLRTPFNWWWSIDLLRRIVIVVMYVFITDWEAKQLALIVASLFIFTIHAQCKPYESEKANLGETFLLFSMTLLTTLQLLKDENIRYIMSSVLLSVSNAYVLCISLYCLWKFINRKSFVNKYRNVYDSDEHFGQVSPADVTHTCNPSSCAEQFHRDS